MSPRGCFLIAALLLFLAVHTLAAGLGIFPYLIDETLPLGGTVERTVVVRNLSPEPKFIEVSLRGLCTTADGTPLWLDPQGEGPGGAVCEYGAIADVVEVFPARARVSPYSEAEFKVLIRAPQDWSPLSPAGRAGGIFFRATSSAEEGNAGGLFGHQLQVVTLVYVRFAEVSQPECSLRAFQVFPQDQAKVQFSVVLENTGNVHLPLEGRVIVRDQGSGLEVAELQLSQGVLFPGCTREFTANWEVPQELCGTFEAELFIVCGEELEVRDNLQLRVCGGEVKPEG
jgi:hypothetical protein